MTNQSKKLNLWISLILFLINIVLIFNMLVEFMNASPHPIMGHSLY